MPTFINMNEYPRRDHFRYFCSLPNPFVSLTVPVDVTSLVAACKEKGESFYLAMMHAVAHAGNQVPQLRQRVRGDGIVQYERCMTSHIELLEDETYCYCTLQQDLPLLEYFRAAEAARAAARNHATIEEDPAEAESLFFISCLPWLHYTGLCEPVGNDSNPRFTWGKYETDHLGRLMIPVSVTAHHGLVDGVHIARFYQALESQIQRIAQELMQEANQ